MHHHEEIQPQVVALLAALGYPAGQLGPATRLAEDLHLDWPRQVALVERLEQHFGIALTDPELHQLRTLRDACRCVERHLFGRQTPFEWLLGLLHHP